MPALQAGIRQVAGRSEEFTGARLLLGAGLLGLSLLGGCSSDRRSDGQGTPAAVRHPLRIVLCQAGDDDPLCRSGATEQVGDAAAGDGGHDRGLKPGQDPDEEALSNVQHYLESIPEIESARAQYHEQEIEDGLRQALRAYGYYSPGIRFALRTEAAEAAPPARRSRRRPGTALAERRDGAGADGSDGERPSTLLIALDAGKRTYIRDAQVRIIGEGRGLEAFDEILAGSGVTPYAPLSHERYEALKDSLRSTALSLGFFDMKFVSSRILVYEELGCADIILVFDTGRRYHFGELLLDEASRELLEPSRSLVDIRPGQDFATSEINKLHAALSQTGYYRSIDLTAERTMAGEDLQVPLRIGLERQPHNIVRTGLGYSTDEGPRLMVEWDKPLLNAQGHSLRTYAKVSGVQQNAQAVYKIPRRNPNTDYYYLRAAQEHTDLNDTLSDRSHLSFHYVANQSGAWRQDYSLALEYEDYEQGLETGHALNLMPGLLLSRHMGDQGLDPRTAQQFTITMSAGLHQLTDATFFRWDARYRLVLSPTENTRFLVRAEQGATWGRDSLQVPPSLRFFAGGDNSIRGYGYLDEATRLGGYLKGSRYLTLASAEFQFPFGLDKQRLAVFADAGLATDDYEDLNEYLLGPGIGYRLITDFGTLRLDLAYGMDREPARIRLHFGFGPEF